MQKMLQFFKTIFSTNPQKSQKIAPKSTTTTAKALAAKD
jgi:hypothetical protein